jgi:hypothetical protein
MNRLAGLSILAVTLVAAGSLAAQETGSTEQAPVAAENPVQTPEQTPPAGAAQVPVSKLPGDSHVRIVRLSQVQGKVGMDRGTGHGVEPSMQNMPIVEGLLLGTANEDSYAEVEFEDGSTMRMGPGSAIAFTQLVTRATGAKATTVRVDRGTVYVSRENTKADEFTLVAKGTKKIAVQPSTHMRLELDGTKAEVAVFSGNVAVDGSGAPQIVGKKQTLTLDVADAASPVELAKKVEERLFDGWDKDAQQYHDRYAKGNSLLGGKGYGISDLNYYGAFATVDGCGTFWQPYFVSASWSPYSTGMWAQYASGYSWVSPYPWGWLPFHTGGWSYCPSRGWGWQPGGSFVGVNNIALVQAPLRNGPAHMPGGALPRPPAGTKASMVVVSNQPLSISKPVSGESFVFQKDSAGLGVPRGSLGKLNGFSNDVARHGSANSHVYVAPAGSASQWNDGQVYHGPLALHRGSMPDEARQAMWARQQAATTGSLIGHHEGQLAAGSGRGAQPGVSQNPSAGWQGRQGQPEAFNNNNGNNLAWKNQQNGANASANANGSHSWNNGGTGAGAGAGAGNGHTWNNAAAGGASGSGHTWNGGGNGGGGGQGANAGGGNHNWGGGAGGGGSSAGSGNSMGHAGGSGGGGNSGGGGGRSSSSGNGSK